LKCDGSDLFEKNSKKKNKVLTNQEAPPPAKRRKGPWLRGKDNGVERQSRGLMTTCMVLCGRIKTDDLEGASIYTGTKTF